MNKLPNIRRSATAMLGAALLLLAIPMPAQAETVSVYATDDSVCVSGLRCQSYSLPREVPIAAYGEVSASVSGDGCTSHVCTVPYDVDAGYYAFVSANGRSIVIGPGPNPPPPCGFTCPTGLVDWVLSHLP